jgi:hypothetical protein
MVVLCDEKPRAEREAKTALFAEFLSDVDNHRANGFNSSLQLFLSHAKLIAPVFYLPGFRRVYASPVLRSTVAQIITHCNFLFGRPGSVQATAA